MRCLLCASVFVGASPLFAAPPDLTNGGTRTDNGDSNLGPTGMRGWIYQESVDTTQSRQILVTEVYAGSPAAGILAANDVILGASGTGDAPIPFSADARKSLGYAIADAEARNPATLQLLRWRAGVTETVTITLQYLGAYSATAPYNCPKSAAILEMGLQKMMAGESSGMYSLGSLALLAADDPSNPNNAARQTRARNEILALIPTAQALANMNDSNRRGYWPKPWAAGHTLIVLCEYYLKTNDPAVLPAIDAYVNVIEKGQSPLGSVGHNWSSIWPDGSPNGPATGYGSVNSAAVPALMGLQLAKKCGSTHPRLEIGIERASRFFASYAGKSAIPYGEHLPAGSHAANGKSGAAALVFEMQPQRAAARDFFAKLATAAASEREGGHTGWGFNGLWSPLGAAVGGEEAAASHFRRASWMFDLCRRWDGSFAFCRLADGSSGYRSNWKGLNMSTSVLLTYALPLRNLQITGKGRSPAGCMSHEDVLKADLADRFDPTLRSTSQLIDDLASFSHVVRSAASGELAARTGEKTQILATLVPMANNLNSPNRTGAIEALGKIADPATAPTLVSFLDDPDDNVRYFTGQALRQFPREILLPLVYEILAVAERHAKPRLPLDMQDPGRFADAQLVYLLFANILSNSITGIDRNYLYPAIRMAASHPLGHVNGTMQDIYSLLTTQDCLALADVLVDSVQYPSPGDKMASAKIRTGGLDAMESRNFAEGVPLAEVVSDTDGRGSVSSSAAGVLGRYAGSTALVDPDPRTIEFLTQFFGSNDPYDGNVWPSASAAIEAILADTNPVTPIPFKGIESVTADAPTLTLPANWTTLRVKAYDHAKGDSRFTWRKVHGAGEVSFSPNGTAGSKNTIVLFDGTPGQYLFEVTMSDSRGFTEVHQTVAVTLRDSGGNLPANSSPSAFAQTLTVGTATPAPITLTGSDPENLALNYQITTPPAHGALSGTAPYLVYTSDFSYTGPDSFTFQVMDSEGQVATATISLTVNAGDPTGLAVYEPFDYPAGNLSGASGASEVGFAGTWSAPAGNIIANDSLAYDPLPTKGGKATVSNNNAGPGGSRVISPSALADKGLLADGATLWMSAVFGNNPATDGSYLFLALANSSFSTSGQWIQNEGAQPGEGVGFTLSARGKGILGAARVGNASGSLVVETMANSDMDGNADRHYTGEYGLIVAKITWGATPQDQDLIEIYQPYTDLHLPEKPIASISTQVNQSTFDTLAWYRGTAPVLDEIRLGADYRSVLIGSAPATNDTAAPLPNPIAFDSAPAPVGPTSIRMVASTAFDPSGVEYFFTCVSGGGHDSGWQSSPEYTDTDLTPGVSYSYTVKARDLSLARNETASSTAASVTLPVNAQVPVVLGFSQAEAEALITSRGMVVGTITTAPSSSVDQGDVAQQNPAGGTSAALGTAVNLVISETLQLATVPNLAGQTQSAANTALAAQNLLVGIVLTDYSETVPAGQVISTNPVAGSQVAYGSTVALLVSAGSRSTLLPLSELLVEDFESPSTPTAYVQGLLPDNGKWVGATFDYGSLWHGMTDKAGGDFSAPHPNYQAYALRYKNTGITTAQGVIGALTLNTRYTVSFDVIRNGSLSPGTTYQCELVAFSPGDNRANASPSRPGSVLASVVGNAPSDGSFARISFDFTALASSPHLGKDVAVRFVAPNSDANALIDNVDLWAVGVPLADTVPPVLVATSPEDEGTGVDTHDVLTLTFNEVVTPGSGSFTIRNVTDGIQQFLNAADPSVVSFSGNTVRLYPSGGLLPDKQYTVFASLEAVKDFGGNRFGGIADSSTWNFTTTDTDATPPTLFLSNNQSSNSVEVGNGVTYILTFSEEINATTLDATDLSNTGTSTVSIGAITEIFPGMFSVAVTPNTIGTLQLQVNAGAVIADQADNPLNTTTAIADAEVLNIVPIPISLITYDGNGQTAGLAPADQEKQPNVAITLATNYGNLVKTGYTFAGWNTAADGTGITYPAGATYTIDAPLTLYAYWELGTEGTWLPTTAGPFNWNDAANWSGGIVAKGFNRTALFTPNITANQTINVDTATTIGNITFTDSSTASNDLTISGASALTLLRTTGTPVINVTQSGRSLTMSGNIAGANGLQKNGAGKLTLSGANTFSGGVFVNAGALQIASAANLGDSANVVTFAGTSTLQFSSNTTLSQGFAINAGVTGTLDAYNYTIIINNSLAGSGTLRAVNGGDPGRYFEFTSTNNTFSGNIEIYSANGGLYSAGLTMASLADTLGSRIKLGNNNSTAAFTYGAGAVVPLVLNNCQIEHYASNAVLNNNATNVNCTVTVNTDLILSRNANVPFTLGGSNTGNNTFAGAITDKPGYVTSLTKSGTGNWIVSNHSNSYTGTTTINGGTLGISKIASYGTNCAIGNGTAGSAIVFNSGTLAYTGSGDDTDRLVQITNNGTILNNGTGALNFTAAGNFNVQASTTSARTLTLGGTNGGTISGAIQNNTGTAPALNLAKFGLGTWTLQGNNTFTGTTTINGGGNLALDYTTNTGSKLSDTAALILGGSAITLQGGSHTEIVSATTLSPGASLITRNGGTGTLRMNAITRQAGSNLSLLDGGIATTDTANVNGILGGWATIGNDWAINSGSADGSITALASYTGTLPSTGTGSATANYTLSGDQTQTGTSALNAFTLKLTGTGATDNTLALGATTLNITNTSATSLGGILYTGGGTGVYHITADAGKGINTSATQDLIINTVTGILNVSAEVNTSDSTRTLLKAGAGTLVLGGANAYTGITRVNEGILRLSDNTAPGTIAGGIVVQNKAALELANSVAIGAEALTLTGGGVSNSGALRNLASNTSSYAGAITIGSGGARIHSDAGGLLTLTGGIIISPLDSVTFGGTGDITITTTAISGGGSLVKDGTGTLTLSGPQTYTGPTHVAEGTAVLNGSLATSAITVANGATIILDTGSPLIAANAAVNLTNATIQITGSINPAGQSLITAASIIGTPTLVSPVPGYSFVSAGNQLLLVETPNYAPQWLATPVAKASATEDAVYSATLANDVSDANNDLLTFAKVSGPAWLSVAANGTLSGTPANSDVGANSFTVSVSDGEAPAVEATLNITVINTNDAPTWTINPIDGTDAFTRAEYAANLSEFASDMDADTFLSFSLTDGPSWLQVASDGTLSGTPTQSDVGLNVFTVSVSDSIAEPVNATLNITVISVNEPPVFAGNPIAGANATEDAAYAGTLVGSATDINNDTLTFAKVNGPAWLGVAPDGNLSGTPTNSDVGPNSFTVSVSDGLAAPVETTLNITVINANDAPAWSDNPISATNATEDAAYSGSIAQSASDVDSGATLGFAKVSGPAWLSVAPDGTLSGTPSNSDVGTNSFTVSVSDGIAAAVTTELNITVTNTNDAPVWTSNPISGAEATGSTAYVGTLAGSATDVDAETALTFGKVGGPAWLSVASDGTLSGTPGNSDEGANTFTVSVSDGIATPVNATLNIQVNRLIYTISYNGNGQSAGTAPASQEKQPNVAITLSANSGNLVKTGYTFAGWNTAADGTGTSYPAGATYTIDAPLTLYAYWELGTDGTWLPTTAGPFNWNDTANWSGGIVANGFNRTALFTPNITAAQTVNVDSATTIGNITFTDSTTSSHDLTISGASVLTLSRTSGTPVINVTQAGRTLAISSNLTGNNGLQKTGAGTLLFPGNNNSYTGATLISAGTLQLGTKATTGALTGTTGISVASGATLVINRSNAFTQAADLNGAAISGAGSIISTGGGTTTLSGANTYTGVTSVGGGTNGILEATTLADGGLASSIGASFSDAANLVLGSADAGSLRYIGTTHASTDRLFTIGNHSAYFGGLESSGTGTVNFTNTGTVGYITANQARILLLGGTNTGLNILNPLLVNNGTATLSLTKSGAGRWILANTLNSYTGTTMINAGTLSITKMADYGTASSIGQGTAGAGIAFKGGALNYTGGGDATNRLVQVGGNGTILSNGTGALNFTATGNFNVPASASASRTLSLGGSNGGTISGAIQNNTGTAPAVNLAKTGMGTWTLQGNNTFSGTATVNGGGNLVLGYTTNTGSKLSDTAALTLGGSAITLQGGSHTEIVSATTLAPGASFITRDGGTGHLRMNVITRQAGSNLSLLDGTVATTDTANVNGILGGWATIGNDWATKIGGADGSITALAAYTGALPTTGTGNSTANYTLSGGQTQTGSSTLNAFTLKLAGTGAADNTLALGATTLNITNTSATSLGGILYTGGGTGVYHITADAGKGINTSSNQDLIINTVTGTLNVSAEINTSDSTRALLKAGAGTLVLGGPNAYTGITRVNEGVLRVGHNSAPGTIAGGIVVQNKAALELANSVTIGAEALTLTGGGVANSGSLRNLASNTSGYAGAITIGVGGARIHSDAGGTLTLTGGIITSPLDSVTFGGAGDTVVTTSPVSGAGGLVKEGAGTLTLSGSHTYTGPTHVAEGTAVLNGSLATSSLTVASGATIVLDTASPLTATNAAVNLTNATIQITGSINPSGQSLITAASITGTPSLVSSIPGYQLQVAGSQLLLVQIPNYAPQWLTTPVAKASATQGAAYSATLANDVTDANNDPLTFTKVSGPAWLSVAADGTLSGTPTNSDVGANTFTVSVSDGKSPAVQATLEITVTGLPLPWVSTDIGTGMLAGSASHNAGTFTLTGSGIVGGTNDQLQYAYQTITGDGEIIARISALQDTGTASRVGVMIRDSLAANSMEIFMGMTGANEYRWDRRTSTGGGTTSSTGSTGTVPDTWVRLVRSGTTITAYRSTNGTSWTSVGSTTNTSFASTCYIGLAVGSGSDTTLNTSQFSNVTVVP